MVASFLLYALLAAVVFVPLERAIPLRARHPWRRPGLAVDLTHLFVTGAIVRLGLAVTLGFAVGLALVVVPSTWRAAVAAQPWALQLVEAVLLADLAFYAAHRAFHRVPALWRLHAVHHSIEHLDWIAAHRVHPVDQIATKGASLLPLLALGFEPSVIASYATVYFWHSLLLHANVRIGLGPLEAILASPRFHHWHHADESEAFDRNFGAQLVLWDRLFGTLHLPKGRMPERYGVDDPVPTGYLGQLAWPFGPPAGRSIGVPARRA